jgi:hypothetical protein
VVRTSQKEKDGARRSTLTWNEQLRGGKTKGRDDKFEANTVLIYRVSSTAYAD